MRCTERHFCAGNVFHIYNHAIGSENLFKEKSDYLLFLEKFNTANSKVNASIFAYCLMPNHFHFLIRQESSIPVYKIFNSLLSSYIQIFNKKYHRKGRMFQSKLQHILVESEDYLLYLCHYIHFNPVKARLVRSAENWCFSNYLEWIGMRKGIIFNPEIRDRYYPSPDDYKKSMCDYKNNSGDLQFLRFARRLQLHLSHSAMAE